MRRIVFPRVLVAALACATVLPSPASRGAEGFSTVHAFSGEKGRPMAGLIRTADGRLYGTTAGACFDGKGSVYVLIPDGANGYIVKTLACFAPSDPGHTPLAAVVEGSDGALYGTTSEGGPQNLGAIFRITTSGALSFLHSFGGPDGGSSSAALTVGSDALLYGTTRAGGDSDLGTVFRISTSGDFESLHSFDGDDGANPYAALLEIDGADFVGTASAGGDNDYGTVFRITKEGDLTTLHEFDFFVNVPRAPLVLAGDGYLYGTTYGNSAAGHIYRLLPTGLDFEVRVGISSTSVGLIEGSDDWLYGSAPGFVFRWHPTRSVEAFHPFEWDEGTPSALIEVGNVVFAGAASSGGPRRGGFVFRVGPYGDNDILHAFPRAQQGTSPRGTLVEGSDGRLYGVTLEGGTFGRGSIFSATRAGSLRTIHSFAQSDGTDPQTGLVLGSDGAFHGIASFGGLGSGTVFRIDFGGAFEVRHQFSNELFGNPTGGLLVEDGGAVYGATSDLFRLDSDGTFTALTTVGDIDLANGALIRASDGSLMGTSAHGGPSGGNVFRWDELNGYLSLHSFSTGDGYEPAAGLVEADGGAFFGTTTQGGASGFGTLFRVDFEGNLSYIHELAEADGGNPRAALLWASDGKLYGTASTYGAAGFGTLFRSDTEGAFEKLHDFEAAEGGVPLGPVLRASDGAFYGTASDGGPYAGGTLFRFAPPDLLSVAAIVPDSGPADAETPVVVSGVAFESGAAVSLGGVERPATVDTSETIASSSAVALPGSLGDLVVSNPGGDSGRIVGAWFADFLDVASGDAFHDFIETIVREGISGGCGGGNYCVAAPVTRAQMAVFLLKAEHGSAYLPPPCTGVFGDVPCPSPFADWIEALSAEGVTAGCSLGNYCPNNAVTRAQMSVFLLKTREGAAYRPPPAVGHFVDVPPGSFAADWIEELSARGISGGCNPPPYPLYCPGNPNTRGQMAVFLTRTFGL